VLAAAMGISGLLVLIGLAMSLNRTYAQLEASRAGARTLVEEAPDAVFVADIVGRYTDVNAAACRMLGYTRDEILAKTIVDVLSPEDVARLPQQREQLLEGVSKVGEWTLCRKDGGRVPVEISAKIFPDGRWQALVRDISKRKRLEGELRAAEAEQKFLADFGSALMSTIDDRETVEVIATHIARELADVCVIETVEEGGQLPRRMVAYRDPAAGAHVDPELEQMQIDRSRHIGTAVIEWKQPLLIHDVTAAHIDGIAQSDEHRRLLRELGPTSLMALPLLAHGGVFGSLLIVSTKPERRYTERELSLAQKVASRAALAIEKARLYRIAQEAVRMREDVLNIVAHDLRNPLGTILLQAAMLRRGGNSHDRPPRKPADVIERSAIRMNHLIQDLLDVARMGGGRLSITQGRVPAGLVISDAVQAQEPRAASASLELRLEVESQLPELWADRDRLLQIFENLIGNAIKFSAAGGRITIGAARADEHILFWVADTGCGIAPDHLPHVFERLWQASKTGQHGAGLGLPIVKGIVEAHGGRVWVESRLGEGTIFFFTIPTARSAEAWRPEHPPAYG
jgi:PAS domain S-box-containing protein